jgi:hypothetical protein
MYFYQIKCCFYTQNGCMNKKILQQLIPSQIPDRFRPKKNYMCVYCHMSKKSRVGRQCFIYSTASFLSKLRAKKVEKLHNTSFYRNFRKLNTGIGFRNRERLFPVWKQTGYIFQSPKTIKTWTTKHYASLNKWYNTEW